MGWQLGRRPVPGNAPARAHGLLMLRRPKPAQGQLQKPGRCMLHRFSCKPLNPCKCPESKASAQREPCLSPNMHAAVPGTGSELGVQSRSRQTTLRASRLRLFCLLEGADAVTLQRGTVLQRRPPGAVRDSASFCSSDPLTAHGKDSVTSSDLPREPGQRLLPDTVTTCSRLAKRCPSGRIYTRAAWSWGPAPFCRGWFKCKACHQSQLRGYPLARARLRSISLCSKSLQLTQEPWIQK